MGRDSRTTAEATTVATAVATTVATVVATTRRRRGDDAARTGPDLSVGRSWDRVKTVRELRCPTRCL
ncbi:MAG: hypothetical protein VKI42_10715 [Synechococcaceae cyanobacterium]|nr:hypothetical protein [Synechococcaceae cyanobacterium]